MINKYPEARSESRDHVELDGLTPSQLAALRSTRPTIKLALFDIDGTLVNSSKVISAATVKALQRIRRLGVKTAVASGRPSFAAQHVIDTLSLNDAGMFYTGAMIYDPSTKKIITQQPLPPNDLSKLISSARAAELHCELYTHSEYFIEQVTEFTNYHTSYLHCAPRLANFNDIASVKTIYKALLVAQTSTAKAAIETLKARHSNLIFATGYGPDRPDIVFTSVISQNACKQKAFAQLCAHHQVLPEQVLSIGDADSDAEFLHMAGTGVAMGNAHDEIKAYANFATRHVDDDGLAFALRSLI